MDTLLEVESLDQRVYTFKVLSYIVKLLTTETTELQPKVHDWVKVNGLESSLCHLLCDFELLV